MVGSLGWRTRTIGTTRQQKLQRRYAYHYARIHVYPLNSPRQTFKEIYGVPPDLTREGGSIPVTLTFAESLGVNVLLLPMGRADDGAQ
jgi:hypothetical protein